MDLKTSETFVPSGPDAADTARGLLRMAARAQLPSSVVRTTAGGFVVPSAVLETEPVDPPPEPKKATAARGRRKKSTGNTKGA